MAGDRSKISRWALAHGFCRYQHTDVLFSSAGASPSRASYTTVVVDVMSISPPQIEFNSGPVREIEA